MLTYRVNRRLEKRCAADPRDLNRVLEGQEKALASSHFRLKREQILSTIGYTASSYVIPLSPGKYVGERALARTIRPHDGMHLAGGDRKVEVFQNFLARNRDGEAIDFQHILFPKRRRRSANASFQADAHKLLRFDGEFHREFLQHFAAKSVDD